MLKGKRILLGITGSIAAYKSAHLVRLLIKEGAEVKVVMTPASKDFVPQGERYGLAFRVDLELLVDISHMGIHRKIADVELRSNLLVAQPV